MEVVEEPNRGVWKFEGRRSGETWLATIQAYWEVVLDPISDDFSPETMSVSDLMRLWQGRIEDRGFPEKLVPIYWYVDSPNSEVFELMPFQYEHYPGQSREDFLTFFSWPTNVETDEPLNWLTLPVVDKRWNSQQSDKGGFIQEATGWRPAILQPFVYLDSLTRTLG